MYGAGDGVVGPVLVESSQGREGCVGLMVGWYDWCIRFHFGMKCEYLRLRERP